MRERTINWGKYGEPQKNSRQSSSQSKNERKINWGKYGAPSEEGENPLGLMGDYLKALPQGTLKRLGEFGASAFNSPTEISEALGGKQLYPHFKPFYEPPSPKNIFEAAGHNMGPGIAEFAALAPPLAASKLISKLPEGASLISKIIHAGKRDGRGFNCGRLRRACHR